MDVGVVHQVFNALVCNLLLGGIGLEFVEVGHDERRHIFAAVANHGDLLDEDVLAEGGFEHLRGNVLAVAGLVEVFEALGHHQLAGVGDVAAVACVKPAVGVDGLGRLLGLVEIALHHGGALHQNLTALAYLHHHAGQRGTNGAQLPAHRGVEADGGVGLAEAVANDYVDAYGVKELGDVVAEHGAGRGEEAAVLHAYGAAQAAEHFLLEILVLLLDQQRRLAARAHILHVARAAHGHGALKEHLHHGLGLRHIVVDGRVHLFPEARHAAHACGLHLAHGLLDFLGVEVDGHAHAAAQAHHGPAQLKHVAEGQEAEREVGFVVEVNALEVAVHGRHEVVMGEHHALGHAGGARGVDEIHQVAEVEGLAARLNGVELGLGGVVALGQELGPRHGVGIAGIAHHAGVESDDVLQRGALAQQLPGYGILVLVAGEQHCGARVVDDVGGLILAAGGVDGHGHGAVVERGKVRDQNLGAVLREYAHAALLLDSGLV